MSTLTDPYGWDDADPTRPVASPAAVPDPRFTPARAHELLDADRKVERNLVWKQLLALLLVLVIVVVRQLWLS